MGSIGQVHRARLTGGEPVIVKVLRPGVEERVERDLEAARALVDAGFALHELGPVQRDLETVFREVSEGVSDAV